MPNILEKRAVLLAQEKALRERLTQLGEARESTIAQINMTVGAIAACNELHDEEVREKAAAAEAATPDFPAQPETAAG